MFCFIKKEKTRNKNHYQTSPKFPILKSSLCAELKQIFHPNIEEDGTIHIDILKENWSPALTIEKLLLSICSILSNPEAQNSINEASMMYKNEYFRFCEVAREWTKIYAMPSWSVFITQKGISFYCKFMCTKIVSN